MADHNAAVSAYEAKRLARVQQNQQMLQSLGIALPPRERKRRVSTRDEPSAEPVERRRSSRLQQQPTDDDEPEPLLDLDSVPRQVRRVRGPEYRPVNLPTVEETTPRPHKTGKLSRQSSTLLDMDMAAFHERWLGRQIWPKGKATVMEGMCPLHVPSFSKMLGIQQWRNGLVLFVNVLGASGYENSFTEVPATTTDGSSEPSAVHFRWFAQERQHEESPAIVRLLAAQHGDRTLWLDGSSTPVPAAHSDQSAADQHQPVLLFLRHIDGPYIYCGRLGYLGHLGEARPMEFRWQLLDLDKIQWSGVKQLLDAADQPAENAVVESHG